MTEDRKCRGVCLSSNTRRMAETAEHLVDHVSPLLPVRQSGIKVPKRLRYFLQRDVDGWLTLANRHSLLNALDSYLA